MLHLKKSLQKLFLNNRKKIFEVKMLLLRKKIIAFEYNENFSVKNHRSKINALKPNHSLQNIFSKVSVWKSK